MNIEKSEVWITGIGLVSSLGEGLETHWSQLTSGTIPVPSVDSNDQAPFPVHPIVDFDITTQIPKRSDQRQMGKWQHLGTYAAGLALEDAGIADDADLLANALTRGARSRGGYELRGFACASPELNPGVVHAGGRRAA